MVDTFTKKERSKIMRAVKSGGGKSTEIKIICLFKKFGIKGWRRTYRIFGNPDFVFPKKRIAIFTDGCFWHGHNCRNTQPKTHAGYWRKKIHRNKQRDKLVIKTLSQSGWRVARIWECEIKKDALPKKLRFLV